ncbi:hypothetical protein PF005_g32047 [Phytophthora fragariae]|nr:hypothetical protein PF009_g28325 [Phytophthora fragariae]KAE8968768.1 hypothetical protein PF011_g27061 [Phytophthora fragariae]KAE9056620.1 hypothetical protein PF010_g31696 [Phytophthora fragariae]KAE9068437.1 hypothetical protein PF007_g27690 [Phytophthora fragariae]KAE9159419.1 hypothetical protein PF005_g32047 [Phytophthora fragariae]
MAKELMLKAMQQLTSSDPAAMLRAVQLAGEAHRMEDGTLVFSDDENRYAFATATYLQDMGAPLTPNMVLLLQPPDRSAFVTFWKSMQLQFPDDLAITRRAACALMFTAYAGADMEHGVLLFQRALSLLPHAEDDSDPQTLGVLYEVAVAYYQTQKSLSELERAETLFARFLKHAPAFGHRKAAEAHFILGQIALAKET